MMRSGLSVLSTALFGFAAAAAPAPADLATYLDGREVYSAKADQRIA